MGFDLVESFLLMADAFEGEGIEYALCGGIAVALYGYPRFTKDIDILIQRGDLERVVETVKRGGFEFDAGILPFGVGTPREMLIYRISKIEGPDILTLDLLLTTEVLESVWESRVYFDVQGRRVCVVSLEGLKKMKMLAKRDQDLLDLKKLGLLPEEERDE
jgi:hypothetical protein